MNIPEIAKCPNPECDPSDYNDEDDFGVFEKTWPITGGKEWRVDCACGYRGPRADTEAEAIRLHNAICRQPTPEAAGKCKLCDDKGRYSVDVYDKDAKAWMPEWRICECRPHPPKPEPTEQHQKGCAGRDYVRAYHDGDECTCGLAERLKRAPKPPAEWMAEAAREIRAAYVAFSVGAGAQPMYDHIERIIAKHFQHAPKEENK